MVAYSTLKVEPDLMKFFSRTLSKAGSNSSPISSIKRGLPRDRLSSRWVLKYLWFKDVTCSSLSFSLFLIQVFPWPCGSMSSG